MARGRLSAGATSTIARGTVSTRDFSTTIRSSSSSRRRPYGCSVRVRPCVTNKSKAQKRTGTSRTSSGRGRRCWGQRRCSRVNDGRLSVSSATISPSSTTWRSPTAAAIPDSSGKVRVTSAPLRENTVTSPSATITVALWPSSFTSARDRARPASSWWWARIDGTPVIRRC